VDPSDRSKKGFLIWVLQQGFFEEGKKPSYVSLGLITFLQGFSDYVI
jgi:hypothetical protein